MKIRKAVITAAGLGTRLLPLTKEIPKEMAPLFAPGTGGITVKPTIHIIFETLYQAGIRNFSIIVGRGKRVLEDYFTPDNLYMELLRMKGSIERGSELEKFYKMILDSKIFFINQPYPRGFGDAVLQAEAFVSNEPFILHAGDDIVLSKHQDHIARLIDVFNRYDADAVLLLEEIDDPRSYGVVKGAEIEPLILRVEDIVEKPAHPPSNLAVVAVYVFKPSIFDYLKQVKPNKHGEIGLTEAIKLMILDNKDVYAVKLRDDEVRLDVGTPERYWNALVKSYEWATKYGKA